MAIKRLPVQLANQIAAGEVVERPSSVVKELIENSLDAGAKTVEVDIEKGGHKRIRIKDDGLGIPKPELELALSPHSTSKIATLDDLENIASLGFRGEALASISSVSRLVLTSKTADQEQGWSALAQGRDMQVELEPAAHPNGTTIDVCDLFYNTPARRKFLRAEKTEFQHIEDIVKRISLSRPSVSFILKHNGKVLKRWMAASTRWEEKRIAQVCGNQFAQQSHKTSLTYEGVSLKAWVGGPDLMRSATDMQFSFVNGRAMRDKLLLHAIRQAYETSCGMTEQPAYVVFIDLSPSDVDVNVHPGKHEVRFHQARQIHDLVCKAFQDGLAEHSFGEPLSHSPSHPLSHPSKPFSDHSPSHDYIQPLQANHLQSNERQSFAPPLKQSGGGSGHKNSYVKEAGPSPAAVNAYTSLMSSSESGYIQIANKGLVRVVDSAMQWIAANVCMAWWLEERLEQARMSQPLLMPVVVINDTIMCEQVMSQLTQLHFEFHVSGTKTILKQVPASIRQLPWGRLFPAVIDQLCSVDKLDIKSLCLMLGKTNALLDDDINQSLTWYMNLPTDIQKKWAQPQIVEKPLTDFTQWIES